MEKQLLVPSYLVFNCNELRFSLTFFPYYNEPPIPPTPNLRVMNLHILISIRPLFWIFSCGDETLQCQLSSSLFAKRTRSSLTEIMCLATNNQYYSVSSLPYFVNCLSCDMNVPSSEMKYSFQGMTLCKKSTKYHKFQYPFTHFRR